MKNWLNELLGKKSARTVTRTTKARRGQLRLENLEGRLAPAAITDLFNTGVDASKVPLDVGSSDPHYNVVVSPPGFNFNGTPVVLVKQGDSPGSSVITPPGNAGGTTGDFQYRTTFTIGAGFDPSTANITGNLAADDRIDAIYINGNDTGISTTTPFGTFSISSGFVSGTNVLDFVVGNTITGSTSLDVYNASGTVNPINPTLTSISPSLVTVGSGNTPITATGSNFDSSSTIDFNGTPLPTTFVNSTTLTAVIPASDLTATGTASITVVTSVGGTSGSKTLTITNPAPKLNGSNTPISAQAGGAAVAVDPNLTITGSGNLNAASVSLTGNFNPSEDRLLFANQNGIAGSYNTGTGILSLSGTATVSQYQAALQSVKYQDLDGSTPSLVARTATFSIAPGTYNPANGHFFEFVSASGIRWDTAKAAADAQSIFGLQGYLATLTSQSENDFATAKLGGQGWLGGSDAAAEGVWKWVDGPETGLQFYSGNGSAGGSGVSGVYNNFAGGEPNNAFGNEDYLHIFPGGLWNDYSINNGSIQGYVIEYGGSAGDPTLQLISTTTINVVNKTSSPSVGTPASPTSTSANTTTLTGTAPANSLVKVYSDANNDGIVNGPDAVVGQQQLTGGATSYSITVPLSPNSPNNFLVTATTSPAAESSPVDVPTVTQDSVAPAGAVVTSPAGAVSTNAGSIAIKGTAEAGSKVEVFADANGDGAPDSATPVASQQLGAGATNFDISTPLTPNGDNKFVVVATDAAGNASSPVSVPTVTADAVAPVKPTLTAPTTAMTVNADTITVQGTAEANSLVKVYNDSNGNGMLDANEPVLSTQQLTGGGTFFSVMVPLTQDAMNHFAVTATDAAGNESAPLAVPTVTEDSTPPALPTVGAPAGATSTNAGTYTLTGTAEAGSLVNVYRDLDGDGVIDFNEQAIIGQQQLAPGQTMYSITVPLLSNSDNKFIVTATDKGGNTSAPKAVPTITADTITPDAPTVTMPGGPVSTSAGTYTLTGTVEAGALVTAYKDLNNNGMQDAGEPVAGTPQQLGAGQTMYSIVVPLDPNSDNNFVVVATDAAGNNSGATAVPTITADSIAPATLVVTAPAAATSTNAPAQVIIGTAEAGSLVTIYQDVNNDGMLDAGDTVVGTPQQLGEGQTGFDILVDLASDADNNFLATATDAAGNESIAAVVPTITQDSIPPADPTLTSPTAPTTIVALTIPVQGTAEAGSKVQVYNDANNNGVIDAGDTVVASQQLAAGATSYDITTPLTTASANHFLVAATDAAGNESAAIVVPTVTENSSPLTGVLFVDANANGVQDPGERGLPNQKVYFDANENNTRDVGEQTATTAGDGGYVFPTIQAGSSGSVQPLPSFVDTDTTPRDGNFARVPVSPVVPIFPAADLYTFDNTDPNTRYVLGLYEAILGRKEQDVTAAEAAGWVAMLDGTEAGRQKVTLGIWNSVEHRNIEVANYYRQLLGRERDAGSEVHVNALLAGTSELDIVSNILGSQEFLNLFSSDAARLEFLQANLLGEVEGGALTLHRNGQAFAASGATVHDIVFSDESVYRQINGMYLGYFQREVETTGLAGWNTLFRQTNSPTLVGAFILANVEFVNLTKTGA